MKTDDSKIATLKVAREELDEVSALHEAWKPAAYDKALHKRLDVPTQARLFS
jgi:hypothetical protein